MKTISINCKSCKGTGLYRGLCERGKSAVVCSACKGTGKFEFEYEPFNGRVKRSDVKRVFLPSAYAISHKDVITVDGIPLHFSKFGCSYEEWLEGKDPAPMEELECPAITFNAGMGHEPLERCKAKDKVWGGSITRCPHYDDKAECWKQYWAKHK